MFIVSMEHVIKPGTLPLIQEDVRLCSVCYMAALCLRSLYRIGDLWMYEYKGNFYPGATASRMWTGLGLGPSR